MRFPYPLNIDTYKQADSKIDRQTNGGVVRGKSWKEDIIRKLTLVAIVIRQQPFGPAPPRSHPGRQLLYYVAKLSRDVHPKFPYIVVVMSHHYQHHSRSAICSQKMATFTWPSHVWHAV